MSAVKFTEQSHTSSLISPSDTPRVSSCRTHVTHEELEVWKDEVLSSGMQPAKRCARAGPGLPEPGRPTPSILDALADACVTQDDNKETLLHA